MSNANTKKNAIISIAALVLIALITAGYMLVPKGVTAVELSDNSGPISDGVKVFLDCEDALTCTIKPKQFADRNVTYEVTDPSVATVDNNGVVTGTKLGETVLTVEAVNLKDKFKVSVLPSVKDIKVAEDEISLTEGRTQDLEAKLTVADKSVNKKEVKVSYSSDKDEVATVDKKGTITAEKEGTAKITISAGGFDKTVKVTVKKPVVYNPPVTYSRPSSGGSSHSDGGSSSGGDSGGGWE